MDPNPRAGSNGLRLTIRPPDGDPEGWRRQLRSWLTDNAPAPSAGPLPLDEHRAWERRLFDAGLAAIHWPAEFGGQGASLAAQMVFQEEYERAGAPPRLNAQGLQLVGPMLMRFGTDDQQQRWLRSILTCDDIWCQGYSEPEAGSDLASLRTSATLEGDHFVVNGQKVWTSGGTHADWMHALVRTGTQSSRHRGITYLLIDMNSPGIDVRSIKQINGQATFAEVFLTGVRVPVTNMVGTINHGWQVAMETLKMERGMGRRSYVQYLTLLDTICGFVRQRELQHDKSITDSLGRALAKILVYRHHVERTIAESQDGSVGPEASYNKLYWSELQNYLYDIGMRTIGPAAEQMLDDDEGTQRWQDAYWYSRASRIFAGTQQIQRNIIAERVLGLPREARA